ncbi:MAG: polysaccharide deacetylase family protein [Methanomassiliicoccales archaeon]
MPFATITVDVDRDVSLPAKGTLHAVSKEKEGDTSPRFQSSLRGLEIVVSLLNDLDIKGTFFMEAKAASVIGEETDLADLLEGHEIASHGFEHEDLTGRDTGLPISQDDVYFILKDSRDLLKSIFGREPKGFRAPYLHVADDVLDAVAEAGFDYDSSVAKDLSDVPPAPFRLPNRLMEVPLVKDRDEKGRRIYSYLWALHEGDRPVEDYLRLIRRSKSGFLVLATHSWHMVETYSGGRLGQEEIDAGLSRTREILEKAQEEGVEFVTIQEYLSEHMGR